MTKLDSRIATDEELEMAHTPSLLSWLKTTATCSNQSLANQQEKYDSIYLHNETFHCASVAAGSVLQVIIICLCWIKCIIKLIVFFFLFRWLILY